MSKLVTLLILGLSLCSCGPLYYGYLPGTDYKLLQPTAPIDLRGKSFAVEFKDGRGQNDKIDCSEYTLDRETELEGALGERYFREAVTSMIQCSWENRSGQSAQDGGRVARRLVQADRGGVWRCSWVCAIQGYFAVPE